MNYPLQLCECECQTSAAGAMGVFTRSVLSTSNGKILDKNCESLQSLQRLHEKWPYHRPYEMITVAI